MCLVHHKNSNMFFHVSFALLTRTPNVLGSSFPQNYIVLSLLLQPADWDDREYIDDPNAVKPEVLYFTQIVKFSE